MAVTNPRNRILIFRLTQGEYDALRTASSEKGARSLSDYARGKLLASPDGPTLDAQIMELRTTVSRIAQLLEKE
jgi:hypothetical protein